MHTQSHTHTYALARVHTHTHFHTHTHKHTHTRTHAHTRRLDLRDIKVLTKGGGTVDDSELVDGLVFDQKASKAGGGPIKVTMQAV